MKKSRTVLSVIILCTMLCIVLSGCGPTVVRGSSVTFTNNDDTFSIDLPAKNDSFWKENSTSSGNTIDVSDKDDKINVLVQCVPKDQIQDTVKDLPSYEDYSMMGELSDILTDADMSKSDLDVPDFISDSESYDFVLSDSAEGFIVFMESDDRYYTYFVIAVDKAYTRNQAVLAYSVLSLQELEPS